MRWRRKKPEHKSIDCMIALSGLPDARWGRTDFGALARDGFIGNAVVYRCIRMIAEAAASIPLVCPDEHLARLLRRPSPDEAGRALLERLYIDMQLCGNAWLEAITPGGEDRPRALFSLRPDTVRIIRNARGVINAYAVRTMRGERRIERDRDDWFAALHLKLYHPGDSDYGLSPLVAARKALGLHNGSAEWAKSLLDNAARPSGALIYGKDGSRLSAEQFDRLKTELAVEHSGRANAGRPLLLEGGLDWKPMSLTPAEMDFRETRHAAAREIALAFGIPPMLLGIPGDNTYATYKEANTAFWRLTVLPLVIKVSEALTVWLDARFADAAIVPDLDQVPAFAGERDSLWARVSAATFLNDEEKRTLLGIDND